LPQALVAGLARETARGQIAWAAAREASSFADFAPSLKTILALKREEAGCLVEAGQSRYDALLVEYEPETSADEVAAVFDRLRPGLTDLRARIADARRPAARLAGHFDHAGQMALARRLGDVFGFDWDAGRLDLAVHPSSTGSSGDVRITTRVDEADPDGCIYSTIHEVGHAVYEQGLDPAQAFVPAGSHASMGIHESQSRLFENQLGRSRAFCEWLHPALREQFGDAGAASPQALYEAVNVVESGFIRTEADEVHYNLHVMMRFDLERALIAGELEAAGLEAAWNERFEADFGRRVPDARSGVLQDVHWSVGLFGYFPTYCLGNIYAAEIHNALRAALPDLDGLLAAGDLAPVVGWLRENIHRKGRLLAPRDLIAQACGQEPGEAALLGYLEDKFGGLYGV
jgi:carboxypeptidase Taq